MLAHPNPSGAVCIFTSDPTHVIVDLNGYLPSGTGFRPLTPTRLLDTRTSPGSPAAPDSVTRVRAVGRAGVPATAGAVALNVTATGAAGAGWVTVWPCERDRPLASNLNLDGPGQAVANFVVSDLGSSGDVCLYTSGGTHLIADVTGWWQPGMLTSGGPTRLLDSRSGPRLAAGGTIELQVAGRAGVPSEGAAGVVLNVTAVGGTKPGWVTVWPCGAPRPTTSNLNLYKAGQAVPVAVMTSLGTGGKVCLYTESSAHLIADLEAWFPAVS